MPARRVGQRARLERGSATAELAVLLPAVVLVAVLCLWAVTAVAVHVRCLDAARTGARAIARGEPPAVVLASASQAAPTDAAVRTIDVGDGLVGVEVRVRVPLPGPWAQRGPGFTAGGRAVARLEDTLADGTLAGDKVPGDTGPTGGRGP